jgi:predicted esterase
MINNIKTSKTAKYSTSGNPETATTVIFALHGYGQLVQFFIRKFYGLDAEKYFVVAPEGLHRFYLKGSSGRVGASWMTKEERETDIDDYVSYLDSLWLEIDSKYNFIERVLLGFSQGGATASRWHGLGKFKANHFILWASVFPFDMELKTNDLYLKSKNQFVIGTEDEYYSEEKIDEHIEDLNNKGLIFELIKFKGCHDIDNKTLLNLM